MAFSDGTEFANWQNNSSVTGDSLGKFALAYGLDKSGLADKMNSAIPDGYQFQNGKFEKKPAVPPTATIAPVVPAQTGGAQMPTTIAPLQGPEAQKIDARAAMTLGGTRSLKLDPLIEQPTQPMPDQGGAKPPPENPAKQQGGGGSLTSFLSSIFSDPSVPAMTDTGAGTDVASGVGDWLASADTAAAVDEVATVAAAA